MDDDWLRIRLLLVLFMAAITLLGGYLWRVQVAHAGQYEVDLTKQSVRRIRIPGARGTMTDRHGRILADNRPGHGIALYMEELRRPGPWNRTVDHVEDVIATLTGIIGRPAEITRDDIRIHIRRRLPMPLLAWRDLDEEALARFVESSISLPGVDIYTQPVRVYPMGRLACHVIGYVGRADPPREGEEEPFHYYLPEMTGRSGLELSMDSVLRGEAGGRLMRVDVSGYRRHDLGVRMPRQGQDILLALDARIQQIAEQALGERPGSIVVLDPRNGDVLALVSSPGYDLNAFVPAISSATWRGLLENPDTPLLNRAVSGLYPPGSTFKMITALAGLVNQRARGDDRHNCPGFYQLGNVTFRCWNRNGHGTINMEQALESSCNVYFFHVALQVGIDAIHHMALAFGLGQRTGIELDADQAGLVPGPVWKRAAMNDGWRDGDTCNVSIGQGALLVTPLQMAMMTAALANGGTVYRPRLVLGHKPAGQALFSMSAPEVKNRMAWNQRHMETVRRGMRDVVMGDRGSARSIRMNNLVIAGKTGTAEFGRKEDRKRHAWMVAFAPYDDPHVALAVLVDEGTSGGTTAAPVMQAMLQAIFTPDTVEGGGG